MRETDQVAVSWREWRWALMAALLVVTLSALPYLAVWVCTPPDKVYTGMLFNSFDGHSYLAKMRQGVNGEWLFRLPFTPEEQRGRFFYFYYLLLGHIAKWLGLPLLGVYHGARLLNGLGLLLLCYRFTAEFVSNVRNRRLAFLIIALSSGVSWITAAFGLVGTDLQVMDTNTFFSILLNAHLPLAEALMLLIFITAASPLVHIGPSRAAVAEARSMVVRRALVCGAASLMLAIVFPMMVFVVLAVLGLFLAWRSWTQSRWLPWNWVPVVVAGLAVSPLIVYYLSLIRGDPLIAEWYAQDVAWVITPSVWQTLAGYGILTPLAAAGAAWCVRERRGLFLLLWAGLALGLVYGPPAMQCRVLTGLHIGIGLLAALGLVHVVQPAAGRWRSLVFPTALMLLVPTTLALVVFHASIVTRLSWPFFMTRGESAALAWLSHSVPSAELVLASPKMGLMIPAWAGQRVVYGHHLETIHAADREEETRRFFAGQIDPKEVLTRYNVRYIFVGPKEVALGGFDATRLSAEWSVDAVYSNDEVTIYRVAASRRPTSSAEAN